MSAETIERLGPTLAEVRLMIESRKPPKLASDIERMIADLTLARKVVRSLAEGLRQIRVPMDDEILESYRSLEADIASMARDTERRRRPKAHGAVDQAAGRMHLALCDLAESLRDYRWTLLELNADLDTGESKVYGADQLDALMKELNAP